MAKKNENTQKIPFVHHILSHRLPFQDQLVHCWWLKQH